MRGGVSANGPRPFAVGVLSLAPSAGDADRREARLCLALRAYKFGYFLLDVVEVGGWPDDPGYAVVERLAARTEAAAFVVQGAVDLARLRRAADRGRMRIRFPPVS
jgi:hypothetical protein